MRTILPNRKQAGRQLAERLTAYASHPQAIVLGLPRGGVPVAYEIAQALNLPLDVCLVRKLGLPHRPEVAMGAITEDTLTHSYDGNIIIIDENTTQTYKIGKEQLRAIATREKAELKWRDCCYRHHRPLLEIRDQVVILVDDGIATGLTMHAAVTVLGQHQPASIIIAVPVAPLSVVEQFKTQVDDVVCLIAPENLHAVSCWYEDFTQVADREVCNLLSQETQKLAVKK